MGVNLSLRSKGILAVLVLLGYLGAIAAFLAQERKELFAIVQQVDSNRFAARLVEPAMTGLTLALVENQSMLGAAAEAAAASPGGRQPTEHLEALNISLEQVKAAFPEVSGDIERFRRAMGSSMVRASVSHLSNVRDSAQALLVRLQEVHKALQREETELAMRYDEQQHFISAFAVSANIVGAVASVAVILFFFSRLASDLKALRERASAVVSGYGGEPLAVTRRDEVGDLQVAVNRMQEDLRKAERHMEVARQQTFHQEKMAAVGSLASAIGHEVSNPMAAISGVAQFIADESASDERPQGQQINQFAREILHQTERVSHIMRQLSTLTAPRSPDPELLDLNALVRSTCGFIRFDKRFRRIELEPFLDPDLPAVMGVADHLTQVLMNLLINAADAMEGLEPERCKIRVATWRADGAVELTVTDTGRGMTPEVLARAFDESFTTKPAGRGRGIGLFICKSLVEKAGGRIELASVPDQGTTATLRLPLRPAAGD